MTRVVFEVDPQRLGTNLGEGDAAVLMYAPSTDFPGAGVIGNDFRDKFERLSIPPTTQAVDLVSLALAVTAADTFLLREDEPDGWTRIIDLDLPVVQPNQWQALAPHLSKTLNFLSGDIWSFTFRPDGLRPPSRLDVKARRNCVDPSKSDCVALFSGGLDSALGVLDLLDKQCRPLLVSHAPHGDKSYQDAVAARLPGSLQRYEFNSYPSWPYVTEITTRTRSFLFLAVAALAAETLSRFRGGSVALNICENGLIALNPPLTTRRIGALSTRTAHPHYLAGVQRLLDELKMPVKIVNPHRHETKGEMLARRAAQDGMDIFASSTVSCGNWKRKSQQCGRCWPCAIRRSAFTRASLKDHTPYQTTWLADALEEQDGRDDVISIHSALKRRYERDVRMWTLDAGPLPADEADRKAYFGVVERGMDELEVFLHQHGLKT